MGPRCSCVVRRCVLVSWLASGLLSTSATSAQAYDTLAAASAAPRLPLADSGGDSLPNSPGFLQAQANAAVPAAQSSEATALPSGTASITGVVSDVNGGLVPGATVSLLDSGGKLERTVTADEEGRFRLDDLPAGSWKVKIAAKGLQGFVSPAVLLKSGQHFELPDTALPIATADQSVDVVLTQEQVAEEEMNDETRQRVLGVFPNFYTSYEWNAAPLVAKQKFKLAFRATTDPVIFITTSIVAGIQQERNTYPGYGDDAAAYGKRYGAQYGNAVVGRFIGSAILPSLFRQDPRYFYMGPPSSNKQRVLHALAYSVIARGDNGKSQPNYSHILGNFAAGYLSRTWHPDGENGLRLAADNALIGIGGAGVQGLVREFVWRHFSTHTPPYAHGKPVEVPASGSPAPGETKLQIEQLAASR